MTAEALQEEIKRETSKCRRCKCGSVVLMLYEPGAIYLRCWRCKPVLLAVPDWDPAGLREQWNAIGTLSELSAKTR